MQKIKKILLIAITCCTLLAISLTVVMADVLKKSAPIPKEDYYGSYIDDSESKTMKKSINYNSKTIELSYIRTENLKENSLQKRADSYGTYDVYIDNNSTEYLYLVNSDVFCGFKMRNTGVATAKDTAIAESDAMQISNTFLNKMRGSNHNYKLISCIYDELSGYYDIQYCLFIDQYKTDDVFRLWVNANGEITSFSEFNYKRYDGLKISESNYKTADEKFNTNFTQSKSNVIYSIVDSYVSINDSGELILIKVVDLKIPVDDNYIVYREHYTQIIN